MENKSGKMALHKGNLDAFFGKTKKESVESDIWRVSLMLTKEDQEIIEKGFESLPRKYKAMRDYFREAMLEIAKRDIEKGQLIQQAVAKIENSKE